VGGLPVLWPAGGAYAEKSPVVIISGAPGMKERNSKMQLHHTVNSFECQDEIFSKVTCAHTVLGNPLTAAYEIDRVLEACKTYKRPVYIELPRDMVNKPIKYDLESGTPPFLKSDPEVLEEVMREVLEYINTSKNPVILAGVEVARFGFADSLRKFAERTHIPVATTILGKSVINEKHPLALGTYAGNMSQESVASAVDSSDCLIMLGVIQTDVNLGFLPLKIGKRKIVLATSESIQIRNSHYEDVLFADFMESFFSSTVEARNYPDITHPQPTWDPVSKAKVTISRFFQKINTILTANTAIIADIGDSLFGAMDLTVHDKSLFFSQAFYTTMGFSVPGCLGLMTAKPKIRPLVFCGDGAFQMTGMEMSTLVRRKLNPIIFVLNNKGYGTERMLLDGPWNDIQEWQFQNLPSVFGGGKGYVVFTEGELDDVIAEILPSHELSIVNVHIDKKNFSPAMVRFASKLKKKL
jgi:indolepyruvate decarboxylase